MFLEVVNKKKSSHFFCKIVFYFISWFVNLTCANKASWFTDFYCSLTWRFGKCLNLYVSNKILTICILELSVCMNVILFHHKSQS